jgi:hypothetical protein
MTHCRVRSNFNGLARGEVGQAQINPKEKFMKNEIQMLPGEVEYKQDWSVQDLEVMADRVAKSKLFGLDASQAFTLMLLCQAEGIHPAKAVQRYHVIQGRPAMKADAMLADFLRIGGTVHWNTESDDREKCEAIFTHPKFAPDGKSVRFSMADAKIAGLTGNSTWQKYPSNMLRARVVSNGVRMIAPGIVAGLYTPEEVSDFSPPWSKEELLDEATVVEVKEHHAVNHPNETGYGSGAYASPAQVKAYCDWVGMTCDEINAKWLDFLTDKKTGEISGKAPAEIVTYWQLSGHLLKFAVQKQWVNAPEESRAGSRDKYAAIAYNRHHVEIDLEAREYCRELWRRARDKHKALPREAGDDDDVSEDEAMDNVAKDGVA